MITVRVAEFTASHARHRSEWFINKTYITYLQRTVTVNLSFVTVSVLVSLSLGSRILTLLDLAVNYL